MKVARALKTKFITHGSVQMKRALTVGYQQLMLSYDIINYWIYVTSLIES